RTGRVTSAARDWNTEINVGAAGFVDFSLAWGTRADLDFYVYAPDGTLAGRAYTLSNPEKLRVDTTRYGTGRYRVRVNLYSGPDSDFTLTAAGYKEETVTGSVSSTQRDGNHEKAIAYTGAGKFTLSWSHRSDLDLFVYDPSGRERGRAYTLNNPEVLEVALDVTGTWRARVNFYSGAGGAYTLKMTTPAAILS
ncbi:MAG TPA: hypothetical protein VK464_00920, partial [Symbiobacteriaceae bacterium]|nr:hypothetical protein [Symbiobacteriaceae bacterium]